MARDSRPVTLVSGGVIWSGDQAAALFFELATAELDGPARRRVVAALGPEASAIYSRIHR